MYNRISINNFRCFDELSIDSLASINLITGKNNVGKTTLLEALWLFKGYHNPELGLRVDALSEASLQKSLEQVLSEVVYKLEDKSGKEIFRKKLYIEDNKIKIGGDSSKNKSKAIFLTSNKVEDQKVLSERFSAIMKDKRQKEVVEILRIVEPRLIALEIQIKGGVPIIHGDIDKPKTFPLPVMGNGLSRLLSIVLSISHVPGGILLVDEVENGFYWGVMENVWRAVYKYAVNNNIQIFATTHSWECIKAFRGAMAKEENPSAKMFRLENVNNKFRVINYTIEELGLAVDQNIEVR